MLYISSKDCLLQIVQIDSIGSENGWL